MKFVLKNTSGFSILMAIGTIGVLLIIVSSLAITYMRESKLSRFSYNEVLVSTAAEGAFEYGMLKVSNHRDGFQDTVSPVEPDGKMLELSTLRSKGLETEYAIIASGTGKVFTLSGSEHLIVPLFVSNDAIISTLGIQSKNPVYHTGADNTTNLNVSGIPTMTWSIIAMSGSENVALAGTGNINTTTMGSIRIKTSQCYAAIDGSLKLCSLLLPGDEEVLYTYDEDISVADFLLYKKDPYFILYNANPATSAPILVNISSTQPFSFPTVTLTAKSNKAESSQVYQFVENKAAYYDALKYGIYNNP